MTKRIGKWRQGEDGLIMAVIGRAWMDWKAVSDIGPERIREMTLTTTYANASLPYEICRFAFFQGFDCPTDEIMAFLQSDGLLNLMSLIGVESLMGRIRELMKGVEE